MSNNTCSIELWPRSVPPADSVTGVRHSSHAHRTGEPSWLYRINCSDSILNPKANNIKLNQREKEKNNLLEMWDVEETCFLSWENRFLYPQRGMGKAEKRGGAGRRNISYKVHFYTGVLRKCLFPTLQYGTIHKFFNRIQPQISTFYMILKYKIMKGKKPFI